MNISDIKINTQSSILIDSGKKIYFDPLNITEEKHDADYIFITHDHYDHFSVPDIKKIINNDTVIIIPAPMEKTLEDSISMGTKLMVVPGEKYSTKDLNFETVASYNKFKPFHPRRAGWCGFIVEVDGLKVYVAGDTDATKEAETVKCDIALVPIGGTFTMNYKEAAKLINIMKPKIAIPTHYGSIVGSRTDGEDFKKLVNEGIKVELLLS